MSFWKLFSTFLALLVAPVVLTVWYGIHTMRSDPAQGDTERFLSLGILVFLLAVLASFWMARRLSRPLNQLTRQARRLAEGEGGLESQSESSLFPELSSALNRTAQHLARQSLRFDDLHSRLETLTSNLSEGALLIDRRQRVVLVNPSAARIMGMRAQNPVGRPTQECLGNEELIRFAAKTLSSDEPLQTELVTRGEEPRFVQARGYPNSDSGRPATALILLEDQTLARRLEGVRRVFISNVSHELKTPITAIKGFAETLSGGALKDPEQAGRFADIISEQADRLSELIEQLMELSRIEGATENREIDRDWIRLSELIGKAIQENRQTAAEKEIAIEAESQSALVVRVNATLLRQAVSNLVENAVRYSPSRERVDVKAWGAGKEAFVSVTDRGPGIEKAHWDRLYERFYRIPEQAEDNVGSGLGLAIVKHIIQAHGGRIELKSEVGVGSTFTLRFPRY